MTDHCFYCLRGARHPLFAYLASISPAGIAAGKPASSSYIGFSSNPPKRIPELNRQSPDGVIGGRMTGPSAPYWQLEMCIGPFFHASLAATFQAAWRKKSRTLENRIEYGAAAAKEAELSVYWRDAAARSVLEIQMNEPTESKE